MFGSHAILLSVTKGSILAYENGSTFSNHRGLYVDLSEEQIFSQASKEIVPHKRRVIRAGNKEQVKL